MTHTSPLATPRRELILTILRQEPGRTATDLSRIFSMDRGSVDYHLRRLEKAGRIIAQREGRCIRYYTHGTPRPNAWGPGTGEHWRIARALEEEPRIHRIRDLAIKLDMSRERLKTVLTHLAKNGHAEHLAYAYWGPTTKPHAPAAGASR